MRSLIVDALPRLVAGLDAVALRGRRAAILTTDTRGKTAFAEGRRLRRIAGMTKGLRHDSAAHGDHAGIRHDRRAWFRRRRCAAH